MCSHKSVWLAVVMSLSVLFYTACDSDDVGDNYYTFTGDTVGSYIEKNPDDIRVDSVIGSNQCDGAVERLWDVHLLYP